MALSTRYESTTPGEGAAQLLMRLLSVDGQGCEGLVRGGASVASDLPGGTQYPSFLATVQDDNQRVWPCGNTGVTDIEFVDTSGACTLYLIPFGVSDPVPVGTRLGNYSIVAMLTATDAPSDSLVLGAGTVVASQFTTYTEDAGARPAKPFVWDGSSWDAGKVWG